jgi:cyclopropane fatty-acyl-phospholipid synthase-like methyltransferase
MRFTRTGSASIILLLYATSLVSGQGILSAWVAGQNQAATEVQPQPRKTSPPYTGDLARFEAKDRAQKLQVERVMDILGIKPGASVADIGAGSGWFTVRAARRIGKTDKVYAVDINPEFLQHIRERAQREGFRNIQTIQDRGDDPLLPANSVNSVLLMKTYHEITKPVPFLINLRKALKSGARVGIVDRNGRGDDHGIDAAVVIEEAWQAGYQLAGQYDFVKADEGVDYFLVFVLRPDGK